MSITANQTTLASDFPAGIVLVARPQYLSSSITNISRSASATIVLGLVSLPAQCNINRISFRVNVVSQNGKFRIGMYSESGLSRIFETTTAIVTTGGIVASSLTAVIEIPRGNYWVALVPNGASATVASFTTDTAAGEDAFASATGIAGKYKLTGTLPAVVNGSLPLVIDPLAIGYEVSNATLTRLDN